MTTCTHCHGTGEDESGFLACAHCDAAAQRAALNAYVKSLGPLAAADRDWLVAQWAKDNLAASQPKSALSDKEIDVISIDFYGMEADRTQAKFARAIEAASGPNQALVEALRNIVAACDSMIGMNDYCALEVSKHNAPEFTATIESGRAALAAAGVEIKS